MEKNRMALCTHKVICHRRKVVAPAWVSGLIEGTSLSSPITSFQQKKFMENAGNFINVKITYAVYRKAPIELIMVWDHLPLYHHRLPLEFSIVFNFSISLENHKRCDGTRNNFNYATVLGFPSDPLYSGGDRNLQMPTDSMCVNVQYRFPVNR